MTKKITIDGGIPKPFQDEDWIGAGKAYPAEDTHIALSIQQVRSVIYSISSHHQKLLPSCSLDLFQFSRLSHPGPIICNILRQS